MPAKLDAVIVGGGPNGLAAAVVLAQAGLGVRLLEAASTVGGGARSEELTLPGFVHDLCSAIHPLAAGSPFLRTLPLKRFGLDWIEPEIALAHPLGDGRAACLRQSVTDTMESLGADGQAYRRLMEPLAREWELLAQEVLQPVLHWPRRPRLLARFGLPRASSGGGAGQGPLQERAGPRAFCRVGGALVSFLTSSVISRFRDYSRCGGTCCRLAASARRIAKNRRRLGSLFHRAGRPNTDRLSH